MQESQTTLQGSEKFLAWMEKQDLWHRVLTRAGLSSTHTAWQIISLDITYFIIRLIFDALGSASIF
jgi:hypothetical protein